MKKIMVAVMVAVVAATLLMTVLTLIIGVREYLIVADYEGEVDTIIRLYPVGQSREEALREAENRYNIAINKLKAKSAYADWLASKPAGLEALVLLMWAMPTLIGKVLQALKARKANEEAERIREHQKELDALNSNRRRKAMRDAIEAAQKAAEASAASAAQKRRNTFRKFMSENK